MKKLYAILVSISLFFLLISMPIEAQSLFALDYINNIVSDGDGNETGFIKDVDSLFVIAQSEGNGLDYSANFDKYAVGDYLTEVDDAWTTWSNNPGSYEDALITNEFAQSVPNSVKVKEMTDVIYSLGDKTSGMHQIGFAIYVPLDSVGYFNVQHITLIEWALECKLNLSGVASLKVAGADIEFSYDNDVWNDILLTVDLDNDWAKFEINGTEINQWQWSLNTDGTPGANQLGCLNFFGYGMEGTPYFYFDNVTFTETGEDPMPDFSVELGGCNQEAIFVDQSYSPNGVITAWSWSFDDPDSDNNTSNLQNPLHLFMSNKSSFNVELEVTDEMG